MIDESLGLPVNVITGKSSCAVATASSKVSDTLPSSTSTEKLTRLGESLSAITSRALSIVSLLPSITSFTRFPLASRRNELGKRIQHMPDLIQILPSIFIILRSSSLSLSITSVLNSSAIFTTSPDCRGRVFPLSSKLLCNLTPVKLTDSKSITSSYSNRIVPSDT